MAIEAQYKAEVWEAVSATLPRFVSDWPFRHIPSAGSFVKIRGVTYSVDRVDYDFEDPEAPDPLLEVKIWIV